MNQTMTPTKLFIGQTTALTPKKHRRLGQGPAHHPGAAVR
jgi:hypothetical protein